MLRFWESVRYHWWVQSVGVGVVLVGAAAGVYESRLFNKVRGFLISISLQDDNFRRI